MKALTLQQPWATLVACGAKRIETRAWSTAHRGELAIHAGRALPPANRALCSREPFAAALRTAGCAHTADLPLGCVLAVCRLIDCRRITAASEDPGWPERAFGDHRPGRFAWYLEPVRVLPQPLPARGRLGLWIWPH